MSFYPVYLTRLHQKKVVLIGGNEEAARKAQELLAFDAHVQIISRLLVPSLQLLYEEARINWLPRDYRYGDLKDAGFVIAADYTRNIAETAAREADEKNLLINVMDNIPLSNSAFGSLVHRGKLTVSFSTNGLAPALAVRLKERFQSEIDEAYESFLELSETLRDPVMKTIRDPETRKTKWYQWVDSETISLLREGKQDEALAVTARIWGRDIMKQAGF